MRDILEDIHANHPVDPTESAQRGLRAQQRKRFYAEATVGEADGAFSVLLDGKSIRTPLRRALAAPSRALAEATAAEWNAQTEFILPGSMPLTRLANAIIDAVADTSGPVAGEIAKYLESDLLCYRAGEPQGLVKQQETLWDPILAWARDVLGARFVLTQGIVFVEQPAPAITAAREAIPNDPWRLGAVSLITTLTGSALIALALNADALTLDAAWAAANVDEDWNAAQWGRDEEALERQAVRFRDLQAAATVLRLA